MHKNPLIYPHKHTHTHTRTRTHALAHIHILSPPLSREQARACGTPLALACIRALARLYPVACCYLHDARRGKMFGDAFEYHDSIARRHRRRQMLAWRMAREDEAMLAQFSRSPGTGAHVSEALPFAEFEMAA